MDIHVSISGDKELVRSLKAFTSGGQLDLKRSLGASGLYLTRFFSGEVFASRGRVIGKPWPRLNDRYAIWKAKRYPGRPPLVRSGEMMRSFDFKAHPRHLDLFNTSDHFDFHQNGEGVPQRMMMRVDQQRATRVVKFITSDLFDQMKQAGLV